jgi:hypothetical protein
MREFRTLVLLVVARMLLLCMLGFIFMLDHYGFVRCTCSVDHSKM